MPDPTIWPNLDKTYTESDLQNLTYTDADGNEVPYPIAGAGSGWVQTEDGTIEDQIAYDKDQVTGFTNPNLHRRIDPHEPKHEDNPLNQELAPREYRLEIKGTNSYRTTTITVHDEESTTSEIP